MTDQFTDAAPIETVEGSIYDWPHYYDFVYGSDWQAEAGFLNQCFDRYLSGADEREHPLRLFEPACGTGRLLYRLARQGHLVSGVDLNQAAIDYCNNRLARNGFPKSAFRGDMCDFQLPQACDAGFNTINSFRHLETDAQAQAHLKCMAAAIRPRGIYVLGLHLIPTETTPDDSESWTFRRGHLQVNASMWLVNRDLKNRLERHAMVFDVYTPTRQFRIRDEFNFRTYTKAQFLELLGRIPEFESVAAFDFAYDMDRPVELTGSTQDVVFILRRR